MTEPETLDNDTVKRILSEINMNEKDLEDGIEIMKQWLTKQPHLPPSASEDCFLRSTIVACKSVERAKSKIDSYFTCRTKFFDPYFKDRDPCKIDWKKACEKVIIVPGMTPKDYKVMFFLLPDKDEVEDYDLIETLRAMFMGLDMFIRENPLTSGVFIITDMSNLSVELTLKVSMTACNHFNKILQEGYPMRIKGLIAFNAPPLAETFFNTFIRPFMSAKLKERMFVHAEDHTALSKYMPLEMLMSDYGGKSPSIRALWSDLQKKLEREREWYLKEGMEKVKEDLRPAQDKDEMKGTFRKLQVE